MGGGQLSSQLSFKLNFLAYNQVIDLEDPAEKFCVSFVTRIAASHGIRSLVSAFNNRRIPRKGIPVELMRRTSQMRPLSPAEVPSESSAVAAYSASGGALTDCSSFGEDPLEENLAATTQRMVRFEQQFGDGRTLFQDVVRRDYRSFQFAIATMIRLTRVLMRWDQDEYDALISIKNKTTTVYVYQQHIRTHAHTHTHTQSLEGPPLQPLNLRRVYNCVRTLSIAKAFTSTKSP